jgi:hypothetical protein
MKGARIAPREGNGGPSPWIAGRVGGPNRLWSSISRRSRTYRIPAIRAPSQTSLSTKDGTVRDLGGAPAITGQRPSADRSPALTARKARGAPYAEAWSTAAAGDLPRCGAGCVMQAIGHRRASRGRWWQVAAGAPVPVAALTEHELSDGADIDHAVAISPAASR